MPSGISFGSTATTPLAHGHAERGLAREVVRDGVDLEPVRLRFLRLAEGRASGADEHSCEDRNERGAPPARSPTHDRATLTQCPDLAVPGKALFADILALLQVAAVREAARVSDL